jgi:uncharacterized membrane protein
MRFRPASLLTLSMLAVALTVFPAHEATASQTTPSPTPTFKACHICDEGLPQPVVCAVLFWMVGCPHCHEVLDNVLPPLQEKYGSQLEILLVEVKTMDDVNRLYEVAAAYGIPRERTGVPFLVIGEHVLIGPRQIPEELSGLIERYLAQGGVNWPEIPGLEAFSSQALPPTLTPRPLIEVAAVHVVLFSTLDCHDCQLITGPVLKLAREQYSEQVTIEMVDIVTSEDVEYLYQVAASFGIPKEKVDLPLLIIGNQVLIDEDIPIILPALIETYLRAGGVERPQIPTRMDVPDALASTPTPNLHAVTEAPIPADSAPASPAEIRDNGFTLAMVIMALMVVALIYSLIAFTIGKAFSFPAWADWLIPVLIVIGIGVASYLSYVETQSVEAFCGLVGDCNTVQQSRYAKLLDILPVGVFGLLGYLGLLATWLARKYLPRFEKPAAIGYFSMAFFAVIFSLYLTYLEPFVIKAVCIWCLTSATIVTLLLLLGIPPVLRQFAQSEDK